MFLKPKSGSNTYLEDSPDHLPDIGLFKLYDAILGPLEVIPLKGKKMEVPGILSWLSTTIQSKALQENH